MQIFSYMFDALLFVNASLSASNIFLLLYLSTCCSFVACIILKKKKEVNWSFYPVLTNINLHALSWYKIFLKSRDVEKVNLIPISLYAEFHLPSAAKKTINHASSKNKKKYFQPGNTNIFRIVTLSTNGLSLKENYIYSF